MTMQKRRLGHTPVEVSPLMFGGNVFGWTVDEATSFSLLDAYVAGGGNFIDTADVYSRWVPGHAGGESETIIGRWLRRRGRRDDIVLATKVGMEPGPDGRHLSRATILRAVEASLRRLQTDYIDLYQSHRDDPDTPQEETLETYDQLIHEGKVRLIGASNFSAARLRESLLISREQGLPVYQTLQPLYNLYDRKPFEAELEPLCRVEGIAVISFYSLASGFLTGKYRSEADVGKSPRGARARDYLNPRGLRILAALDEVAARTHATPAQVAIAWLLTRPTITAPIASATSLAQLQELMDATQLRLDADAVRRLNLASAEGEGV